MAGTPRSAKNAKMRFNATAFFGSEWEVKISTDENDASNFEGAGFSDVENGLLTAEVTFTGYLDATQNPFDSPPNLGTGQTLTNIKLYLNDISGPFWLFPTIKMLENTQTTRVHENLMFSGRFKNKGTFSAPTGSF